MIQRIRVQIGHGIHRFTPELGLLAFLPFTTAAAKMADGEIGEKSQLHLLAEMLA